jgi:hypothetical protein
MPPDIGALRMFTIRSMDITAAASFLLTINAKAQEYSLVDPGYFGRDE